MELFQGSPERLAQYISKNPKEYEGTKLFLQGLRGQNVLSNQIEGDLEKSLNFMQKADIIAKSSEYFIFKVYDSWAERTDGIPEGFSIFQKIGDKMIEKIGLTPHGAKEIHDVIRILKKHKVNRLFTLNP